MAKAEWLLFATNKTDGNRIKDDIVQEQKSTETEESVEMHQPYDVMNFDREIKDKKTLKLHPKQRILTLKVSRYNFSKYDQGRRRRRI